MSAVGRRRYRLEAEGLCLPFRPLARLAQNEEPGCAGREAGGTRGLAPVTYLLLKRAALKPALARARTQAKRYIKSGVSSFHCDFATVLPLKLLFARV
jgi:hypothetical protein